MKQFYILLLIVLSWLVLSPCSCHPTLGRNRSNHIQCIDTERDALLQFKHGITTDDCGLLTTWEPHTDCCQWTGVVCSNLNGHVISIRLPGANPNSPCLEGEVSPSLGELKHLKYLNLSYNYLYGDIPHQLGNELSGEIPDGISGLTALGALDLSGNNLSGYIPFEIGNLAALELLDLSNNHLSGKIPISLAKVTTLDVMDVSNNNLSGEIPVSTQLQSFVASLYVGNPGLCGAPLPSCSNNQKPSNVPNIDNTSIKGKDEDFNFFLGLYISVALGFIVGFWGVCGTLVIKTSWRHAYFKFLENIKDRLL